MQPLLIELVNFGPYRHAVIDFQAFYEHSLFLISGKTGAGKTTIFDGMCFALYGITSGGLRQGKEMRSTFADTGEETRVRFVFRHGSYTYEIVRSPEQTVAKKRGSGTREQPASVSLTVFDDTQQEIQQYTKQKDIGPLLEDLLHLNAAQFAQIVMLPQGEFRRFLNADSSEKEKVLRKLFGTDMYRRAAEQIKEQQKQQSKKIEGDRQKMVHYIDTLEWEPEFAEKKPESTAVDDVLRLTKEQHQSYHDSITRLDAHRQLVTDKQEQLEAVIRQKEQLLSQFAARDELLAEQTRLTAQADDITSQKVQLKKLQDVQAMQTDLRLEQELLAEHAETEREHQTISAHMTASETKRVQLRQQLAEVNAREQAMAEKTRELTEMRRVLPLFEETDKLKAQQKTWQTELEQQTEALQAIQQQQTVLENRRTELNQALQKSQQLWSDKHSLEIRQQQLEQTEKTVRRLHQLSLEQKTLADSAGRIKTDISRLSAELTEAEADYSQCKSDWAAMQIARLSMDLIEGAPCPVCGATEHPEPYHAVASTSEEIARAEQLMTEAEETVQLVREKLAARQESAKHLDKQLADKQKTATDTQFELLDMPSAEVVAAEAVSGDWDAALTVIQAELSGAEAQSKAVNEALTRLEESKQTLNETEEQLKTVTEQKTVLTDKLNSQQQQLVRIEAGIAERTSQFPPDWHDAAQLTGLIARQETALAEWNKERLSLGDELNELDKQRAQQASTQSYLAERLTVLGKKLDTQQTLVADKLAKAAIAAAEVPSLQAELSRMSEIEAVVAAYQSAVALNADKLTDVTAILQGQEKPEMAADKAALAELMQEKSAVETEKIVRQETMKRNDKTIARIKEVQTSVRQELVELTELTELSDVLNGDGANKMSIERYVLQTYFEEVLDVANERLQHLTRNRYAFELNEAQGSYKKRTGLEINVYDDNVGGVRSVNTLSGGESFIAALSLSLALAEVIQRQAGGVQIDALFIDEGFGSLDEDALETAIESLEMIEGDGRLIGIISHVKELKERIPQQLEVLSSASGQSTVKQKEIDE